MANYSPNEARNRQIVSLRESGVTGREVARLLGISPANVSRIYKQWRRTGEYWGRSSPESEKALLERRKALELRNQEIVRLRAEGYSARTLARKFNLNLQTIYGIWAELKAKRIRGPQPKPVEQSVAVNPLNDVSPMEALSLQRDTRNDAMKRLFLAGTPIRSLAKKFRMRIDEVTLICREHRLPQDWPDDELERFLSARARESHGG